MLQGMMNRILSRLLSCVRQHVGRCYKEGCLTACAVFTWTQERIPDTEILRYRNEMDAVACLCRQSSISEANGSEKLCLVDNGSESWPTCLGHFHDRVEDPWEVFIEQRDLLVWRREVPNHRGEGLYEYKVYGSYDDITAVDFLAVHVDTEFRKEWDSSAVALEVLEEEATSNSEVIYWEMAWPRLMSNRDYVFKRRYMIDNEQKVIVIISRSTEHPSAPVKPGKHRVAEFWSTIVIKPFTELDEPGLKFSMTYFDNPGLVFSTALTSWVTATGFPDFLGKLHDATLVFAERRIKKEKARLEERRLAKEEEERKLMEEEEIRKKDQEESEKVEAQIQKNSRIRRAWESFEKNFSEGPVLSTSAPDGQNDTNERLNDFMNKLALLVT